MRRMVLAGVRLFVFSAILCMLNRHLVLRYSSISGLSIAVFTF